MKDRLMILIKKIYHAYKKYSSLSNLRENAAPSLFRGYPLSAMEPIHEWSIRLLSF